MLHFSQHIFSSENSASSVKYAFKQVLFRGMNTLQPNLINKNIKNKLNKILGDFGHFSILSCSRCDPAGSIDIKNVPPYLLKNFWTEKSKHTMKECEREKGRSRHILENRTNFEMVIFIFKKFSNEFSIRIWRFLWCSELLFTSWESNSWRNLGRQQIRIFT